MHVFGDLGELQIYRKHEQLPDHLDPSLTAYRKLTGFVKRVMPGGAWSVAQCVRAALKAAWTFNTRWTGKVSELRLSRPIAANSVLSAADGDDNGGSSVPCWQTVIYGAPFENDAQQQISDETDQSWAWRTREPWLAVARDGKLELAIGGHLQVIPASVEVQPDNLEEFSDHDFSLGVVHVKKCASRTGNANLKAAIDVTIEAGDPVAPAVVLWPRHEKVRYAIRQVSFRDAMKKTRAFKDRNRKDDMGDTRSIFEDIGIEELWEALQPDERQPLETFLNLPILEERGVKACSRMVMLLDRNWCKSQDDPEVTGNDEEEDRHVGFIIVRTDRKEWSAWSSKFTLNTLSDDETNRAEVIGPRLVWEFESRTRANSKSNPMQFLGLRVTPAVARLLAPNKRPAEDIEAPRAVVTTSQELSQGDVTQIVRPVWEIFKCPDREPHVYRLKKAEGYDWQENWFRKIYTRWKDCRKRLGLPSPGKSHGALKSRERLRLMEWGLSHWHEHQQFSPQWAPLEALKDRKDFKHLVITDLNFGFRRFWQEWPYQSAPEFKAIRSKLEDAKKYHDLPDGLCRWFVHDLTRRFGIIDEPDSKSAASGAKVEQEPTASEPEENSRIGYPDWWLPLLKWSGSRDSQQKSQSWNADERGWIVAILGRQLPLNEDFHATSRDEWDRGDLWHLLRNGAWPEYSAESRHFSYSPLFRDRTVVVISGNLLRASGAMISHRLSWEHTAVDCLRELSTPTFRPLLEFRHLIIRFGCAAAIHIGRDETVDRKTNKPNERTTRHLFYDATARDGFHRDRNRHGQVIGANSVIAARVLSKLIEAGGSRDFAGEESAVHEGIRQAIADSQKLYDEGYGKSFDEQDPYRIDYAAIDQVLFKD